MVKIEFERIALDATEIIELAQQQDVLVRETPHMGGPYGGDRSGKETRLGKYAVTLGGGANHVVMVDSINAARDSLGKPAEVAGRAFVSTSKGARITAAALNSVSLDLKAQNEFSEVAAELGIEDASRFCADGVANLVALHSHCLEAVVAEGTAVTTFADYWRENGDIGEAMMEYMAKHRLFRRWYDSEARKTVSIDTGDNQVSLLRDQGTYFDLKQHGSDRVHGLLPHVTALFAVEAVRSSLAGGYDFYDHLYVEGSKYTQRPEFIDQVTDIVQGTLAELGVQGSDVKYGLIIADNGLLDEIGAKEDHFSLMRRGDRFDATTLIEQWEACNA